MEHNHDKHHPGHNHNAEQHDKTASHKHKHKNHFNSALAAIIVIIAIVSLAFMSENDFTGYVVSEGQVQIVQEVPVFDDFKSLETLSPGNYYVDNDGVVYWLDDGSLPVVAKIKNLGDGQRSRKIYIDNDGNVGYLIS